MSRSTVVGFFSVLALASTAHADAEPVRVLKGLREPQVAVSPSGGIYVVAATREGVISITSSSDGKSFFPAVEVGKVQKLMLGMRRGPRVAVTGNSVVVTAIGSWEGRDGELVAFRSTDGGGTWSGSQRVNAQPGSAIEGLHGLAAGPKNEVACVWLDLRNRLTEVYVCVSQDGGATWPKDVLAYRSPSGTVCECCHPSVAISAKGEIALMFRNSLEGARDLWLVRSKDHGKTWGGEQKLGQGTWELKQCPMDGGAIAAAPDGTFDTIWRRAEEVFVARVPKAEQGLGGGTQPVIAHGPGGLHALWLEKRGGELRHLGGSAKAPRALAKKSGDPSLAAALDGRGPVVAAWNEDGEVAVSLLAPRK